MLSRIVAAGRAAFTLVELLVVVAIIAIVISIALPALAGARASARGVACLSGLRSIGQAVTLYADANRDHYPISSHTSGSIVSGSGWLLSLQPYGVTPTFRKCPLDPFRAERLTSYATNEHFEPLTPGVDYHPVTRRPLPGGRPRAYDRMVLVPRPAATIYVYEPAGAGSVDHLSTHQFASPADVETSIAVKRHLGAANYLYADGHAAAWAWPDFRSRFSPSTSPFDPAVAR